MSTAIEQFLYGQDGTHGVVSIALSTSRLVLTVAPHAAPSTAKIADFADVKIASVEVYSDKADDLNLPWDIIGFDSYPLSESRWRFVLHCSGIEYCFESQWPQLLEKEIESLPNSQAPAPIPPKNQSATNRGP